MSGEFISIQIPPGVVTEPTKNMRSSNWAAANLMRWIEGEMQPIGGQSQYHYTLGSRCKAIHGWYDLTGAYHIAYVCEQNVYVDTSGTLTEITPSGGWPAPPMPGQGGYGDLLYGGDNYGTARASSSILDINTVPNVWSCDNYGALLLVMNSVTGRLLMWNPATTANANEVQTLTLTGAPTAGTFTLTFGGQTTAAIASSATAAAVQSALTALSSIGAGNVACAGGPLPGAVTITFQGALANAPQLLIGVGANNLTGGSAPAPNIVETTAGASLLLVPVPGAPKGRCFSVTQERFVMIFGMYADGTASGGYPWRFGWSDQDNLYAWNFSTVTSQAGFLDIQPASPIITAISGKFGTLIFTAKKVYGSAYIGLPYVFNCVELADNCTPYSPASIVTTSSLVLWMAEQGMFSFDGTTITPVPCNVRPWIINDIYIAYARERACAVHIGLFSEFWWFYPQSGQVDNTRAVIFNYREGWWSQAQMARSAGITSSYTVNPILANVTTVWQHELGPTYSPDAPLPWAETFDLNLTSGKRLATLKQVIPDVAGDPTNVQFAFFAGMSRSKGLVGGYGPPGPIRPDGYVDARVTGRDIRMQISTIGPGVTPFTVGQHLVDFAVRGDR